MVYVYWAYGITFAILMIAVCKTGYTLYRVRKFSHKKDKKNHKKTMQNNPENIIKNRKKNHAK